MSKQSIAKRAALIAIFCGAIIAIAVIQGRAFMSQSQFGATAFRIGSNAPVVSPIAGSRFIRSYDVILNGEKSAFGHYASGRTAREIIELFQERLMGRAQWSYQPAGSEYRSAEESEPVKQAPATVSHAEGFSALSYVTEDGTSIGILAYDSPDGGCLYFAGAMPALKASPKAGQDVPGREPPGVPRIHNTTRTLCIENLGGVPSVLNMYDAWGAPTDLAKDFTQDMMDKGWEDRPSSDATLTKNYEGEYFLSFVRGHEQCIIGIDRNPKTGKIIILVFWAERAWMPKGTAL